MNKKTTFNEFKKWLDTDLDADPCEWCLKLPEETMKKETNLIGQKVKSKISVERLMKRMSTDDINDQDIAEDFCRNGGMVVDIDDQQLLIEVENGTFLLKKCFVKLIKTAS